MAMTPAVVTGCGTGRSMRRCAKRSFEKSKLVGELGGNQHSARDGRVEIWRSQVRKPVRRSHGRVVDTVADAWTVPTRDNEGEIRVARVVIERPATAGHVRSTLKQRLL